MLVNLVSRVWDFSILAFSILKHVASMTTLLYGVSKNLNSSPYGCGQGYKLSHSSAGCFLYSAHCSEIANSSVGKVLDLKV